MALVDRVADYKPEATFKALYDELMADSDFRLQSDRPAVNLALTNPRWRWNQFWLFPSQVVHGTLADVFTACRLEKGQHEPVVVGHFDSEMDLPNGALMGACMFPFYAARHLEEEFGLPESSAMPALLMRFHAAATSSDEVDAERSGGDIAEALKRRNLLSTRLASEGVP